MENRSGDSLKENLEQTTGEAQEAELDGIFGEVQNQLDDKGRVSVPKGFQALFNRGGYLSRAFNGKSLAFYPLPIWNGFQAQIKAIKQRMTENDPAAFLEAEVATGKMLRFLSGGMRIEGLDNQKRLTIPLALRSWAKMSKEITLIGMGDTVEIWDTETWHQYIAEQLTIEQMVESSKALRRTPA